MSCFMVEKFGRPSAGMVGCIIQFNHSAAEVGAKIKTFIFVEAILCFYIAGDQSMEA